MALEVDAAALSDALIVWLRLLPTAVLSAAMLPHQACAWVEGIFSETAEFETTPKSGAAFTTPSPKPQAVQRARVHWYALVEVAYVIYEGAWMLHFYSIGRYTACLGSAFACFAVGGLCCCYGDQGGRARCAKACDCKGARDGVLAALRGRDEGGLRRWRAPLLEETVVDSSRSSPLPESPA